MCKEVTLGNILARLPNIEADAVRSMREQALKDPNLTYPIVNECATNQAQISSQGAQIGRMVPMQPMRQIVSQDVPNKRLRGSD